jgi:hypothetical protein
MAGGPSQFETYDPKPGAPVEYRGSLGTVATRLPGVHFSEFMVQQAAIADKLAVIRSIHHKSSSHEISAHLVHTGYYLRNPQRRDNEMPAVGSISARLRGASAGGLPPYVAMTEPRYGNAGWLGKVYNPFVIQGDPGAPGFRVRSISLDARMPISHLNDRRRLLAEFDRMHDLADNQGVAGALDRFTGQAFEMITSDRARKAFDVNAEDAKTRDAYGRNAVGQSLLLARRLVEAGVTFVNVCAIGWDDHRQIAKGIQSKAPQFDRGMAALVRDLSDRGLDRDVLVVAMGEFGRTPRVNEFAGRDHWGSLMSVLIAGGGLRMGQVIGSSNSKGEVPADRPYGPENVLATIYRHLGIDPATTLTDLNGRPRYVLDERDVVQELV